MAEPLAVLIVNDDESDSDCLLQALRDGGYLPLHRRVDASDALLRALDDPRWQLVLATWGSAGLSGLDAFRQVRARGLDLPFIVVADQAGEDAAAGALRAGVHDFVDRSQLGRLVPTVARALAEAASRRQRRLVEAELQHRRRQGEQSERLLRLIIESVPDAVAVVDNRGEFLLWNQSAEPIIRTLCGDPGDPGGIAPGFFLADRATRVTDLGERLQQVARGEPLEQLELYLRHQLYAGGRYLNVTARPLRDASGIAHGAVAVFHDTSAQRAAQEQLMISDRLASLGMLAAGVAHEINNPLAAVLANLSLAQGELGSGPGLPAEDTLSTLLADAHDAAERVRQIVRDLRVFSRADEPRPVAVDIAKVLDASIRMSRHQHRGRATLVTDYAAGACVVGNESRLGQVFLNLIVNAAQAIPEGQPEQNRIDVRTRVEPDREVAVEISDTGSGMTAETRQQLFTPFFTTKSAGVGTGLGLAICQRIVHALGGRIEVDSEPGQGSTFRVVLPAARPAAAEPAGTVSAAAGGAPAPVPAASPARRARVLVIDDEPLIGAAVAAILGTEHDVESTTDAAEALARIDAGEQFDVILCDLLMPGMGGIAFEAELRRRDPELAGRLLFLTGGASSDETRDFIQAAGDRVVDKPFDAASLLAAVRRTV
jgi:signal transduction histidine kinase